MKLKLRLILLTIAVIPQFIMFAMTRQTYLAADKYFNQVEAVMLASALFIALSSPSMFSRWLIGKPLTKIKTFCSRIKAGNYKERLSLPNEARDGEDEDEFIVLMRNLNWMARKIEIREEELEKCVQHLSLSRQYIDKQNQHLITINKKLLSTQRDLQTRGIELEKAYEQMRNMAMTDPLTCIANRRCFFAELNTEMQCQRPLSMVMLDIDHFKKINDTYGHDTGDQILVGIGALLQDNTRKTDIVARVGGEEYAILLPNTCRQEALHIISRIKTMVETAAFTIPSGEKITATISAGLCTITNFCGINRDDLYKYADKALYFSKNNGRNSISIFDPCTGNIGKADCS